MRILKDMCLTFLLEEHRMTGIKHMEAAEKHLASLPLQLLFDLTLEKARQQGMDAAQDVFINMPYEKHAPDFSYANVKKGKL